MKKIMTKPLIIIILLFIAIISTGIVFTIINNRPQGDLFFKKNGQIIVRKNGVEKVIGFSGNLQQIIIEASKDKDFLMYKDIDSVVVWDIVNSSKRTFNLDKKVNAITWGSNSNEIIYSNQDGLWKITLSNTLKQLIYKNKGDDFIDLNTKITPNQDFSKYSMDFSTAESASAGTILSIDGTINTTTRRCGVTQDWSLDNKSIIITQKNVIGGCNGLYLVNTDDGKDIIVNNNIYYPESAKFYNNDKNIYVIENDKLISLQIDTNEVKTVASFTNLLNNVSSKSILYEDNESSVFLLLKSTDKDRSSVVKITKEGNVTTILEGI